MVHNSHPSAVLGHELVPDADARQRNLADDTHEVILQVGMTYHLLSSAEGAMLA
jgi:hypothetical protein